MQPEVWSSVENNFTTLFLWLKKSSMVLKNNLGRQDKIIRAKTGLDLVPHVFTTSF